MILTYQILSPFDYDPNYTMTDNEEFLIEEILAHRGDKNRRSTMEFLVKWAGYDNTHNSWEPYRDNTHNSWELYRDTLRDTEKLISYLKKI